jgi:hypothetical protein
MVVKVMVKAMVILMRRKIVAPLKCLKIFLSANTYNLREEQHAHPI